MGPGRHRRGGPSRRARRSAPDGRRRIHALELNGLRPWAENQAVVEWASRSGHPLISGGDRHGGEPNSILNLTNAGCFCEFAAEVRERGRSEVLFLDQYWEPRTSRILKTICDIMGDHPELAGRAHWSDRVFYARDPGVAVPVAELFRGNVPMVIRCFVWGLRIAQWGTIRRAWCARTAEAGEIQIGPQQ